MLNFLKMDIEFFFFLNIKKTKWKYNYEITKGKHLKDYRKYSFFLAVFFLPIYILPITFLFESSYYVITEKKRLTNNKEDYRK